MWRRRTPQWGASTSRWASTKGRCGSIWSSWRGGGGMRGRIWGRIWGRERAEQRSHLLQYLVEVRLDVFEVAVDGEEDARRVPLELRRARRDRRGVGREARRPLQLRVAADELGRRAEAEERDGVLADEGPRVAHLRELREEHARRALLARQNFSAERDASPTQPLRLSNPRSRCFAFRRMIRDSATPASRRSSAIRAPRASASTSVSGASRASSASTSRVARSTAARDCATRQRSAARRFSEKVPARSTRSVPLSIGKSRPITPARAPAADCPLAAMRIFPAREVPARISPAREPSVELLLLLAARRWRRRPRAGRDDGGGGRRGGARRRR